MIGVERPPQLWLSMGQEMIDLVVELDEDRRKQVLAVDNIAARSKLQRLTRVENVAIPVKEGVSPGQPDEIQAILIHLPGDFAEPWMRAQLRLWKLQSVQTCTGNIEGYPPLVEGRQGFV